MMGQIICLICGSIACIYCLFAIHDRYKPSKKENKLEIIETPSYDEFCLKQYRSSVRSMCDCVQDDGKFCVYPSEYIVWQTGYKSADIKDIAIFITSTRNIYRPNEYEIVLQTGIPFEHLESLYTRTTYRVIVLKKYKKETEPMDEKQKILNDIKEAQRKLDEARKKLDEYNTGYKRWKPSDSDEYFYICTDGTIGHDWYCEDFTSVDKKRYDFSNCFKTKEEAKQEAEKILIRRQLEGIARILNEGEKIDWDNREQLKYCIELYGNDIITNFYFAHKSQGTVYCLDKNFLDIAKREIGEDRLIKYIRGEG